MSDLLPCVSVARLVFTLRVLQLRNAPDETVRVVYECPIDVKWKVKWLFWLTDMLSLFVLLLQPPPLTWKHKENSTL